MFNPIYFRIEILKNLNRMPYNPAILLLAIYSQNTKPFTQNAPHYLLLYDPHYLLHHLA